MSRIGAYSLSALFSYLVPLCIYQFFHRNMVYGCSPKAAKRYSLFMCTRAVATAMTRVVFAFSILDAGARFKYSVAVRFGICISVSNFGSYLCVSHFRVTSSQLVWQQCAPPLPLRLNISLVMFGCIRSSSMTGTLIPSNSKSVAMRVSSIWVDSSASEEWQECGKRCSHQFGTFYDKNFHHSGDQPACNIP